MKRAEMLLPAAVLLFLSLTATPSMLRAQTGSEPRRPDAEDIHAARPYTRWWWFADVIQPSDVRAQLDWMKANGFGGVEIAFVYPLHGDIV